MVTLTINGKEIKAENGSSVLKAALDAGIKIPHLCYLEGISEIGACRLCCVEVEGVSKPVPACKTIVKQGMTVRTDTPQVLETFKTNLKLIIDNHKANCSECSRSGSCNLEDLARENGLLSFLTGNQYSANQTDTAFPIIRDSSKCIKCMRCVQICNKVQGLGIWNLSGAGKTSDISVSQNLTLKQADCSACGQCITHCPVGALHERDDIGLVKEALSDSSVTTVVQIAPAVRAAWGEAFGISSKKATVKLLAAALRKSGFDYVFDTSFSADLTIMEEGSEFLERLKNGDLEKYPMFTSCCPGWVSFIKSRYPELVKQLSTAKSPQQMFGSVIKNYFAEKTGKTPDKIFSVSIMPCTAKKAECELPGMQNNGVKDVDCVLTTREVSRLIKDLGINVKKLDETEFDSLMGSFSGAGVIFGATGGVMEAALRSAYYLETGTNPPADAFKEVRSKAKGSTVLNERPWREATFDLNGKTVRVAVTSSLGNADKLCKAILNGEVKYDFVEIMACPGGCVGGGGQIIAEDSKEMSRQRGDILYSLDSAMNLRFSHENPDVLTLYKDYYGKPLSEKSEKQLHTEHN